MGTGLRGARGILLAAAAALLLGLPFLGALPLFDPDEAFYPATAAESLDAGEPLDLRLNGAPRWAKPPGCYAAIQAAFAVAGRDEASARLPTLLLFAATVLVVGAGTARAAGPRAGSLAALVLASSFFPAALGRAAHPETGQVLGTAAAQCVLALAVALPATERPRAAWLLAGIAMGFGFLWKSPVALALPGLMVVALAAILPRDARPSAVAAVGAWLAGCAVAAALAAPWFLWMGARHGGEFWGYAFGQLGHFTDGRFDHDGPPWYFVLPLLAGFAPWTGLLPAALRGVRRDGGPRDRWRLAMAAALATSFLFFTVSRSKLGNYALAFFPPLASLAGLLLDDLLRGEEERAPGAPARRGGPVAAAGGVAMALGAAFVAGAFLGPAMTDAAVALDGFGRLPWDEAAGPWRRLTLPVGGLLLAAGTGALLLPGPRARIGSLAAGGLLLVPVACAALPDFDAATRPWARFAARIEAEHAPGDPVVVYRMRLPSLTFRLGRPVAWPESEKALAHALRAPGRPFLVIKAKYASLADPAAFQERDRAAGMVLLRRRAD